MLTQQLQESRSHLDIDPYKYDSEWGILSSPGQLFGKCRMTAFIECGNLKPCLM